MELIHIANATFSSSKENTSLENLASKQKTFQIVKEHTMRPSAPRVHASSRSHMSSR